MKADAGSIVAQWERLQAAARDLNRVSDEMREAAADAPVSSPLAVIYSINSSLLHCGIQGCQRYAMAVVSRRAADDDPLSVCAHHAFMIHSRAAERGLKDIAGLGNEELRAMAEDTPNEFREIIGRMVAEERWKKLVKRAKAGKPKPKRR